MDKEFEVLCDDGETITIYSKSALQAMIDAAELGFKPVEVEASYAEGQKIRCV